MFNFCDTMDTNRHQNKNYKNIERKNSKENLVLEKGDDFIIENSIFFTDEEIDYKIYEEQIKTTRKLEQDISNINDMLKILNEEIIRDGENLETISKNIESSQRNVDITNESLENIVVFKDNNRKIIIGGTFGIIIGACIFTPVGILIGLKTGIILIISGPLLSGISGSLIGYHI